MSTDALRHFVEEAMGTYGDGFLDWFPGCFHWAGLCADAPAMVANVEGVAPDEAADDLESAAEIIERAERVFRFAHLGSLAVLAASGIEDADPPETLARLVEEPDDGEEAYFESLAAEVLGPLEEYLAGEDVALDARGEQAYALFDAAWPVVATYLAEPDLLGEADDEDDAHANAERSILQGIAVVGTCLAAFRWLSAGRVEG